MSKSGTVTALAILVFAVLTLLSGPGRALAHCDTLGGPVVTAAKKALETGNVNLVLIWVQKKDEAEIKKAFEKTLAVRKLGPAAAELADMYFFETLVRIHRAGEGAPYTGLKPAGADLGPAIPAADKALETGDVKPLLKLLMDTIQGGLQERFEQARAKKKFDRNDVEAGRQYVRAYVTFVHYVEGIYQAATSAEEGHLHDAENAPAHKEEH